MRIFPGSRNCFAREILRQHTLGARLEPDPLCVATPPGHAVGFLAALENRISVVFRR